jgi:2-C-methyl-D-erythritol 4-phosphate cytidylyltransferase
MTSAIIVAAGKGVRMGPSVEKLFLEVAGRPIIAYTWQRFDTTHCIDEILLVVRPGMEETFTELAQKLSFRKPFRLIPGGKERQDSVWNGLVALHPSSAIVAIQDGARPCTSPTIIESTIEAARTTGAAVAARRVTDTIKESDGSNFVTRTLGRARLWSVQTPQTFRVEIIRRALAAVREKGLLVTDDTAACEYINQPVSLVEDSSPNPKVTLPADLPYVQLLLESNTGA